MGRGAFEISTGAPLPAGCDAVVRIEEVRVLGGGKEIELCAPARAGDFVRRAGADIAAGAPVLEAGTRLDARHILVLSALGLRQVRVRRRPRVALISTGRELVAPGRRPGPGRIRNSTAAYLAASLPEAGTEFRFLGNAPDDPAAFERLLGKALAWDPQVVVTTGAVSMGRHDFVPAALRQRGARALFHRVAIRPGKPVLAAALPSGALALGMPGNPVSTVVALRFFLLPYLRALLGQPEERSLPARLAEEVAKPEGLLCFYKARLAAGARGLVVRALPGQASFQIKPLVDANAWVVLPEEGDRTFAGTAVEALPLWPSDWAVAEERRAASAGEAPRNEEDVSAVPGPLPYGQARR